MGTTFDARSGEPPAELAVSAAVAGSGGRRRPSAQTLAQNVGLPLLTVVGLLAIWELISRAEIVDPIVLPAPTQVVDAFWSLVQTSYFWDNAKVTIWETMAGLFIGVVGAWALGTLIGLVDFARRSLYPLVVAFQVLPRVALAPLFLVWFGFGLTPRVMFATTICFFPVVLSVIVGLQTVDPSARELMRSFGATRWQVYRKLAFPSSLPIVFAGVKTAATLALIGAIVGEFVGGDRGIGVLINSFNNQLEMADAFASILALAIFGLALYGAVDWIDKKVVFWRRATS